MTLLHEHVESVKFYFMFCESYNKMLLINSCQNIHQYSDMLVRRSQEADSSVSLTVILVSDSCNC